MFELQIVQGEETVEQQSYYKVVERYIPGTRGLIYDTNGQLLAYNELSFSVLLEDSAQKRA
jgi:penicillin-binding protein 2